MRDWICSQLGAREHFAIPRALLSEDRLARVYTDLRRPGLEPIEQNLVTTFPIGGLKWCWKHRYSKDTYRDFIAAGSWFSKVVRKKLQSEEVSGKIFFGYDTGFLEAARELKDRGATCVLGQMDPGRTEFELVEEERALWPGWEDVVAPVPEAYHARREEEWEAADQIIVNSEWSRMALLKQGVCENKLKVIPLCYEAPNISPQFTTNRTTPLQVLWLGQVNLRKGIPYFLEAAEKLQGESIQFTIAGPVSISEDQVSRAPSNVRFAGRVRRNEASTYYQNADLFVLPTISDGFAITQLEAMAHGLPVITTPNAGKVVEDGLNGFVIPIRDAETLSDRILELERDRKKLSRYSFEAKRRSGEFGLNQLARDLLSLKE